VLGFCSFAGDGGCHHRQRREKERKPTGFPAYLTAARETTRRHCSCGGRRASLQFLEFRDYFVIFKLCNVIFV